MIYLRTELEPGVEVMTGSGIFGHVVAVNRETQRVTVTVAPGTNMDVHLQAIAQIVEPDSVASSGAVAAGDVQRGLRDDVPQGQEISIHVLTGRHARDGL